MSKKKPVILPMEDYVKQVDHHHEAKPVDYVINGDAIHTLKIHEIELQYLTKSVKNLHWLVCIMSGLILANLFFQVFA